MALGFIVGAVFGAMVMGVACYFYDRRRFEGDHARVVAIARYEGHRAAREKFEELELKRARQPTREIKVPLDERPTQVR